jgi:transposase
VAVTGEACAGPCADEVLERIEDLVERGFRDLKTVLELRPVFHHLEHRIRAHVLLC